MGRLDSSAPTVVQYEPVAKEVQMQLTVEQQALLREGLTIIVGDSDLGDIAIAMLRAEEVLSKWRKAIETAVGEGADEAQMSEACQPSAQTPAQETAFLLAELNRVQVEDLELPPALSKEERALEITQDILKSTKIAEPIKIVYFSNGDAGSMSTLMEEGGDDASQGDMVALNGCATKVSCSDEIGKNKWSVTVRDDGGSGRTFEVSEEALSGSDYVIERSFNDLTENQRRKVLAKVKRTRQVEARKKEKELTETTRAMRKAEDRKEYDDLLAVMASSRPYAFVEFNALADRMRRPFHCVLEGREVCVTESDAAIMLEGSALKAIGQLLVSNT